MTSAATATAPSGLAELAAGLLKPGAVAEAAVVLGCLALAWGVVALLRRGHRGGGFWLGERGYDGVLFPWAALAAALVARTLLKGQLPMAVFALALPILASLAAIRTVARVLRRAWPDSGLVHTLERSLSWAVWGAAVLWITGLAPQVLDTLDSVRWKLAGAEVSLRTLIEGALSALVVMLLMLWLSAAIEARLLAAGSVNLSLRKIAANATRALLLLVGLLLALSAAGIPLGALSVMGGAFGVGLGLGLQKLAANYVSGFVILAERSVRIGDVVRVDGFEGRITDITTRYTLIRASNGRESIVPNEMMVTQRVESCTLADPQVAQTTVLQVAYGSDLATLLPQLQQAVARVPRVLAEPAPAVQLSQFAADGLELTVVFWIADPAAGTGNVRSDVNLALLAALQQAGVDIPFPQRVMHQRPPPQAGGSIPSGGLQES